MNGLIDVGQAEGAFMMGLGIVLFEKVIYDPETGRCLTNGTWDYKVPTTRDIPLDFKITFLKNNPNPNAILGSKAIGEPPIILSNSIYFAIKNAIAAARLDKGIDEHFKLDLPSTVDKISSACMIDLKDFTF
jgi:xanthine dehydrogenase/oxidase